MSLSLISHIEILSGADRDMDVEIACAVGRENETHVLTYTNGTWQRVAWRPNLNYGPETIPTPSYSIDAALTLLPEGL